MRVAGLGGTALPNEVRAYFEPRFGRDFSQVRVHADGVAAVGAQAVQARAFTFGRDIVFGADEYSPATAEGKRLVAHELTHVVQQGAAPLGDAPRGKRQAAASEPGSGGSAAHVPSAAPPVLTRAAPQVARQANPEASAGSAVGYVAIYLDSEGSGAGACIDFHTAKGMYRYHLEDLGELKPGEYQANVVVKGNNVDFTLDVTSGELFGFKYRIDPGQPNPTTFFRRQPSVTFTVSAEEAPPLHERDESETANRDPNAVYLTVEEVLRRCASGNLPGVKVFPFRGTRSGGAPLTVFRDGDDIVVKSYVYVLGNPDFRARHARCPRRRSSAVCELSATKWSACIPTNRGGISRILPAPRPATSRTSFA